jgi:hypothetical protein
MPHGKLNGRPAGKNRGPAIVPSQAFKGLVFSIRRSASESRTPLPPHIPHASQRAASGQRMKGSEGARCAAFGRGSANAFLPLYGEVDRRISGEPEGWRRRRQGVVTSLRSAPSTPAAPLASQGPLPRFTGKKLVLIPRTSRSLSSP